MAGEADSLRDWHRLFGLLLTDFFTDSPFAVEIESDLSKQQQFLDVVILRKGEGSMTVRLPDGLDDLREHNLITFKSHHEALDSWAMKELIGHYVAYRKLASPTPSALLSEERFRLYAVCARFPDQLSGLIPWQERQPGVYHCHWGTDVVRVIVVGRLPREVHNAPLHLFSAAPELSAFGRGVYRQKSPTTSLLLRELLQQVQSEGLAMPYTMEDFIRDSFRKHYLKLQPEERREVLQSLPAEERKQFLVTLPPAEQQEVLQSLPLETRLAGLSAEQIRQYLDQLSGSQPEAPRKPRRKK
jgi:hypothetical protein